VVETRISGWTEAERGAQRHFSALFSIPDSAIDVQRAAMAVLGLDDPFSLLGREWTTDQLVSLLQGIDFAACSDYEEVGLPMSILPVGVPRELDEETIKFYGEKWRIYKYDPDPFPFIPHAHNLYEGVKLDLRDGKPYRKRQLIGVLSRKALLEFRSRVKRIALPQLSETVRG
jgi:hypothetical protein